MTPDAADVFPVCCSQGSRFTPSHINSNFHSPRTLQHRTRFSHFPLVCLRPGWLTKTESSTNDRSIDRRGTYLKWWTCFDCGFHELDPTASGWTPRPPQGRSQNQDLRRSGAAPAAVAAEVGCSSHAERSAVDPTRNPRWLPWCWISSRFVANRRRCRYCWCACADRNYYRSSSSRTWSDCRARSESAVTMMTTTTTGPSTVVATVAVGVPLLREPSPNANARKREKKKKTPNENESKRCKRFSLEAQKKKTSC